MKFLRFLKKNWNNVLVFLLLSIILGLTIFNYNSRSLPVTMNSTENNEDQFQSAKQNNHMLTLNGTTSSGDDYSLFYDKGKVDGNETTDLSLNYVFDYNDQVKEILKASFAQGFQFNGKAKLNGSPELSVSFIAEDYTDFKIYSIEDESIYYVGVPASNYENGQVTLTFPLRDPSLLYIAVGGFLKEEPEIDLKETTKEEDEVVPTMIQVVEQEGGSKKQEPKENVSDSFETDKMESSESDRIDLTSNTENHTLVKQSEDLTPMKEPVVTLAPIRESNESKNSGKKSENNSAENSSTSSKKSEEQTKISTISDSKNGSSDAAANTNTYMYVADEKPSGDFASIENIAKAVTRTYSDGSSTVKDQYKTDPVPIGKPMPVEPGSAIDYNNWHKCTLSIDCITILSNKQNLTEGKERYVPGDGTILATTEVLFYDGESVFDVLSRECEKRSIQMESSWTPIYNSAYVEGINNLYEFDCGSLSGWCYSVNGWFPNYGCSRYQLQEGDVIKWRYTCNDLGKDIGVDWDMSGGN